MGVRFSRHLGRVESLDPGQFTVETASGLPALRCPACGGIYDLPLTHAIDEEGRVSPALHCAYSASCAFFDFVHLESFGEDVLT